MVKIFDNKLLFKGTRLSVMHECVIGKHNLRRGDVLKVITVPKGRTDEADLIINSFIACINFDLCFGKPRLRLAYRNEEMKC